MAYFAKTRDRRPGTGPAGTGGAVRPLARGTGRNLTDSGRAGGVRRPAFPFDMRRQCAPATA